MRDPARVRILAGFRKNKDMQGDTEYDELFDWAPVPFLEVDVAGGIHRANQAACDLFEYSRVEFLDIGLSDLSPSGNFPEELTGIPEPKTLHFHCVSKTGHDVDAKVHIAGIPQRANGTDLFRVAFIVLNGPESRAAKENELKRLIGELDFYRVRWESILRQLPGGVLIVDTQGRVVLTNDWMQKLLKYPLPEYESGLADAEMPGWRATDGSPYPVSRWPPLRCLTTGESVFGEEMIFDLDAHTQAHLEVSASPIKDRHNRLIAVASVFFDVTAQRLSEKSFRASEARYRDIFEQDLSANFILTRRLDAPCLPIAPLFLSLDTNRRGTCLPVPQPDISLPAVDRDAILERANQQPPVAERRFMRLHRRNGLPILLVGTIRAARDNSGKLTEIHCHFADVTERRRAERKVTSLSAQLLQVQNEERRKLSHDLHDSTGQDLSALSMTIGLIEGAMHANPEKLAVYIAESKELVQACIRDIRTISYTLHPPLLNELGLHAALKWFIEGFSGRSSIEVQLEVAEALAGWENLVEITLFRIVQQALSNVHRHSGSRTALVAAIAR